jgi:hypothetical protein
LPETRESLGKYQDFPRLKSNFPRPKYNFSQWLSNFSQRLSAFFSGFPLSSMASNFPQLLSTFREIRENLSTAASIQKIAIRASYFPPLAPQAL